MGGDLASMAVEINPVGGSYGTLHTLNSHALPSLPLDGGGATKVTLADKSGVPASGIKSTNSTAGHVVGPGRWEPRRAKRPGELFPGRRRAGRDQAGPAKFAVL
ncbi:MAG: hypothetical protein HKN82_03265 [Akkermansiaceae bacterium]|nr:hypothetical protein [Akkermansiaceae bacterium]NNM28594.1 hypothetical protein [Akkermansiaceae bacterium]